ncbi:RNA exonuclease 3 [Serendipita sp. 401]|nr:RNA exonuclease 3 [Serendipita sp. 401]
MSLVSPLSLVPGCLRPTAEMFAPLSFWRTVACSTPACHRINCPFSHVPVKSVPVPADELKQFANGRQQNVMNTDESIAKSTSSLPQPVIGKRPASPLSFPATESRSKSSKRTHSPSPALLSTSVTFSATGYPTNLSSRQKSSFSTSASSSASDSENRGPPKLVANPMTSKVPLATRQAMLTIMYDAFKDLYHTFHPALPVIAHNDALAQEAEVYAKSNKATYKNAMITSIAAIKKRPIPNAPSHPSVGSDATRAQRAVKKTPNYDSYTLSRNDVEPLLLKEETMRLYRFPMEVPSVQGGTRPHSYGEEFLCDRCGERAVIKHDDGLQSCQFHWGRPIKSSAGGQTNKIYACCSAPFPSSPGCQFGPHVFVEKAIEELHSRHPFTQSTSVERSTNLEIATIDCEGVYTTQGMSVARVSVCDADGKVVFDELVRPDDGVEVIDFNTRFSGVTSLSSADLDLEGIRRALDALIGPQTVIIGHAVENDLMMLRMIHHRLVDTIILYPSPFGLPYKRSLRAL